MSAGGIDLVLLNGAVEVAPTPVVNGLVESPIVVVLALISGMVEVTALRVNPTESPTVVLAYVTGDEECAWAGIDPLESPTVVLALVKGPAEETLVREKSDVPNKNISSEITLESSSEEVPPTCEIAILESRSISNCRNLRAGVILKSTKIEQIKRLFE